MLGDKIFVNRNEQFSMNFAITTNGIPFIVDSNWQNPFLCITVAAARYDQKGRYISNWWLDMSSIRRFSIITPILATGDANNMPTGIINIQDAVYYTIDASGNKYFWQYSGSWQPYSFKFSKTFSSADTSEWVEQNYMYGLRFMSGTRMYDFLLSQLNALYPAGTVFPTDIPSMVKMINKMDKSILKGIDTTEPLTNATINQVLLEPTELTVNSDPAGGIY